jgi:glycosyltransferase involved in cell wall biosynthesis
MANSIIKNDSYSKIQIISSPPDGTSTDAPNESFRLNPIEIQKPKNLIVRAFKELSYSIKLSFQIDKNSMFQIYTVPSPLILVGIYFRKTNFAIDVRDCSWDYIEKKGLFGKFASKFLKGILRPVFKKATFISCTNKFESQSILKNFKRESIVIPNGIENSKYQKLIQMNHKASFVKDELKIIYAGNIGYAQSLITLVKSTQDIKNINVELIGEGAQKSYINDYISNQNIKNIKTFSSMDWKNLVKKYIESDILYAQITKDFSSAIPTKIFEYIAMRKKIVLGLPDGPAKSIFSEFSGVFIHEPENIKDCIHAINLAKESNKPDIITNNLLLKNYIRENFEQVFFNEIPNK